MNTNHPGSDLFARIAGEARRLERRPVDRSVDKLASRQSFAAQLAVLTHLRTGYIEASLAYCGPEALYTGSGGGYRLYEVVAMRAASIREERLS